MANTPEPRIESGNSPEASLQSSIVAEAKSILDQSGLNYLLLESFGLDLAFFIDDRVPKVKFIEVKAFVGSRQGGVGIGNSRGKGTQIDLLINPIQELGTLGELIAWVVGFGNIPLGIARYSWFSCIKAKKSAMGGIQRGKQNNLRVSYFKDSLITWDTLSQKLARFLLG
jgi:hypothetical protein